MDGASFGSQQRDIFDNYLACHTVVFAELSCRYRVGSGFESSADFVASDPTGVRGSVSCHGTTLAKIVSNRRVLRVSSVFEAIGA